MLRKKVDQSGIFGETYKAIKTLAYVSIVALSVKHKYGTRNSITNYVKYMTYMTQTRKDAGVHQILNRN